MDRSARWLRRILLSIVFLVPLLPNPRLFTNSDSPKWALLVLLSLLALLLTLYRAARSREETKILVPEGLLLVLGAVLVALVLRMRAADGRASVRALSEIGTLTVFAFLAARYLSDAEGSLGAFAVALAAGALASLAALSPLTGPEATFGNPSFAAEFEAPVLCLAVALFLLGRRVFAVAGGALLLAGLLLARSRADWLGLAAGFLTLGLVRILARKRHRLPAAVPATLFLAGITALPFAIELLPASLRPGRGDTVRIRALVRRGALRVGLAHPLSGVGVEGFRGAYPLVRDPEEAGLSLRREVSFVHDLPLQVFAETGFPGLLVLLAFLWTVLFAGFRTCLSHPGDGVALGALGAVTAILVSAQFSAPLRHPGSAVLFFLLAGLLAARRPRRFVDHLRGRVRRTLPVLLMAIPAVTAAVRLVPHLRSDYHLAAARRLLLRTGGAMDADPGIVRHLQASVRAEPNLDALRELAFHASATGRPRRALTLAEEILALSPWDEAGRIERARAFIALDRPADALPVLDRLASARPGDDVVLSLRARARWALGRRAPAQEDVLAVIRSAPVESAARLARAVGESMPEMVLAVIRTAERLARDDPDRGLAVLEALGPGEPDYYRAVILAARGDLDGAMNALRAAEAAGVVTRERLANDPRLDPLRDRADFRRLSRSR